MGRAAVTTAGVVVAMLVLALGAASVEARVGQALPPVGYVDAYRGVALKGQCVPNARRVAFAMWGREFPYLGERGVAAQLWEVPTPRWAKVPNDGRRLAPPGSVLIWGRAWNGGSGHVGIPIGVVDGRARVVRTVDCNWRGSERGEIHDVSLNDPRIVGWLVPR